MKLCNLKSVLATSLAFAALLAGNANANHISADKWIGEQYIQNPSDKNVVALNSFIPGDDFDKDDLLRINRASATIIQNGDTFTIIAPLLQNGVPSNPSYFVLKFGLGGQDTSVNTFFFENLTSLNQLVFNNEQVNFLSGGCGNNTCNLDRLSFIGYIREKAAVDRAAIPSQSLRLWPCWALVQASC